MTKNNNPKMSRQLRIYDLITEILDDAVYGPQDIMNTFRITRRMLQRDLKDLRDSGLIKVKYNRKEDRYVIDGDAVFDDTATPRRKQHLLRLYRLGILIHRLSSIDSEELETYEHELQEFNDYLEYAKEDPENNTPEDIENMRDFYIKHHIELYDLKAEYYALFPNSNERTRQRDFREMSRAGFNIYYSRKYKSFIYEYDS
ncbi:MAG: hypothetical protein IKW90_01885 [Lachnospiraceae bacterium]|nr:hypothetical protein [Lachnospiraceae bacterium]